MICGSMICRAAICVPVGVMLDVVMPVVVIAPVLFGLTGRDVAVSPSRLLPFVPTRRAAAGTMVAVSVMVSIVIANAVVIVMVVVVFVFREGSARKQSNHDYGSRN
jgi:hypothetical protein